VLIAYAGFYSISLNSRFLATETTMTLILGSLPFIGTVILIALAAWIIRSFAESDPDPLILNFTFFAVAGQAILTPELMKAIDAGWVAGLSFVALVLVLLQVLTIRDHATVTVERYRTVLNTNRTDACTDADIEHWAIALVRITGRDFSPQFSNNNSEASDSGSRGRRRREALNVLPKSLFKVGTNGIEQTTLTIPDKLRRWRWWAYVGICIASWLLFLGCILIVRLHK
jgi:hypothetical protein